MNPLAVFAPLLHALTSGRYPLRNPFQTAEYAALGEEWNHLLDSLRMSPSVLLDVATTNSLHPHFHYRHFTKPKKDGGQRLITEPDTRLKALQRWLAASKFLNEKPHPATIAYRKKKSIADHVWPHAGAEILIAADIEDFFPATSAERVEIWWRERVDAGCARLLTRLTTYRGGLPQGAPTSPALSNLLNRDLDERLFHRASQAGARYTRYCDDMVFSWRHWPGPTSDFENGVRSLLHELGYTLHPQKGWRMYRGSDEPEITGAILTRHGGVRLPERMQQTMRDLKRSRQASDGERLAGYLGYQAMLRKRPRR